MAFSVPTPYRSKRCKPVCHFGGIPGWFGRVKRSTLKPGRKQAVSRGEKEARDRWFDPTDTDFVAIHQQMRIPYDLDTYFDPHHVLRRQVIQRWIDTQAYELRLGPGEIAALRTEKLWDLRNRLWVPRMTHSAHHSRFAPIPYSLIPAEAIAYAEELGLLHILEREYS